MYLEEATEECSFNFRSSRAVSFVHIHNPFLGNHGGKRTQLAIRGSEGRVRGILLNHSPLPEGEYIGTRELRPAREMIIKHILALQTMSCTPNTRPTKILFLDFFRTKGPYLTGSRIDIDSKGNTFFTSLALERFFG